MNNTAEATGSPDSTNRPAEPQREDIHAKLGNTSKIIPWIVGAVICGIMYSAYT